MRENKKLAAEILNFSIKNGFNLRSFEDDGVSKNDIENSIMENLCRGYHGVYAKWLAGLMNKSILSEEGRAEAATLSNRIAAVQAAC